MRAWSERQPTPGAWGMAPALWLVAALGLIPVAAGYNEARLSGPWAQHLYWLGIVLIFAPSAARLLANAPARSERVLLVIGVTVALYGVKVLRTPLEYIAHDELLHVRTAEDIARTGQLFLPNPLIPVSPFYPGLELATVALADVSGLTLTAAGLLVIGAGRVIIAGALFLLYEEITQSERIAGLAALLYTTNPGFVYFDTQFSYESLALPLAALAVYLVGLAMRQDRAPGAPLAAGTLTIGAVVVTHHLTSYFLAAFLLLWTVVAWRRRDDIERRNPWLPTTVTIVLAAVWLIQVAPLMRGYLAPQFQAGAAELTRLLTGTGTSRTLFRTFAGQTAPLVERAVGFSGVLLILAALPFGLWHAWQAWRRDTLALTLAAAALAYPVALVLRLTQAGAEASNRSSEFVAVATSLIVATAATRLRSAIRGDALATPIVVGLATLMLASGVILGIAPWFRMPGPYLVSADVRSIEPEGLAAARWALATLGPDHRVAADRINGLLMLANAQERVISSNLDAANIGALLFATRIGPIEFAILRAARVEYLVVDQRLSTGLPMVGVYVEGNEPRAFRHETPVPPAALAKFDGVATMSRIFDSGNIAIYDVRGLSRAR